VSVDALENFVVIDDDHLGSGYQWLYKLSRPTTIGALVLQVMQTDDVLKKYANDFSLVTMQKWYKALDKGNNY
jgi:hypothetical protein